jgi:hypothetical protein
MRKVILQLLFISSLSLVIISCEKEEEQFPPFGPEEKTLISFPEGGNMVLLALDITPGIETIDVVEIQREAVSSASLQKPQIVKVQKNTTALVALGDGEVVEMPETVYEHNPENPFDGQFWTVTFQPGESRKFLKLDINTSALAQLTRVGMGFQLAEAPGAQISTSLNQTAVEIGAKNQWDGVYRVKYRLFHPTNPGITGNGQFEWDFPSSGPNSIDWDFATIHINFATGGLGFFGLSASQPTLQTRMIVNPDNSVTVTNASPWAVLGGFPPLVVPPGANNHYDPATKTFYAAYTWTPAGSGTRERYDTLTYVRPR